MPTTSSYYSDLQYPTVNQDGTTWGGITNTYLDEVLKKVKALSDRITTAQGQLGDINRGTNAVDNLNSTLSSLIGTNALLPGTGTTLLPDPYSGTYTKTTTWPAFTSELSSYSPPTTQSEVENFDYQNFANVLSNSSNTGVLDLIESKVTQAEQDILTAQQDTCRAKKYIEAYNNRTTVNNWTAQTKTFTDGNGVSRSIASFVLTCTLTGFSGSGSTRTATYQPTSAAISPSSYNLTNAEFYTIIKSILLTSTRTAIDLNTNHTSSHSTDDIVLFMEPSGLGSWPDSNNQTPNTHGSSFTITPGATTLTVSGPFSGTTPSIGSSAGIQLIEYKLVATTSIPTADLSSCENPSPPYFI